MRVTFCPYFEPNPYQRRLAQELEKIGAVVEGTRVRTLLLWFSGEIWRAEVLHVHWPHHFLLASSWLKSAIKSTSFILQLAVCRVLGKRIVWTAHNLADHERRYPRTQRTFVKLLTRLANHVLVHTHAAAGRVADAFGIPMHKIRVVPHAHYIDDYPNHMDRKTARAKLDVAADAFAFLFLGQIRAYKGIQELIDAFGRCDVADARLLIVGKPHDDGVDRAIRDWIDQNSRIDYRPGYVPADEMQLFFNAADVAVLPFTDVLTSGSLLLAMSFAKPCIIPDIATLTEVIAAEGAILYDPCENQALAAAMGRALQQRGELPAMGQANLDAVKSWGWPEMARATYQVYSE